MVLLDCLYCFFLILLAPLWLRYVFNKKYRVLIKHRFSPDLPAGQPSNLWIHAVSVGEVMSLKHLLDSLKGSMPFGIVLTVTTPSGYAFAKKAYPETRVIAAPLDFTFTVRRFIRRINPALLILNELEIWPNWITMIKRAGIPCALINGRISNTAMRRYHRCRFFLKPFFRKIDRFMLQSEIYRDRFLALGAAADRVTVCGNIKADEAWELMSALPDPDAVFRSLKTSPPGKPVVTLASTHPGDEEVLLPVIKRLGDRFAFILVPRHVERSPGVRDRLKDFGIHSTLWSGNTRIDLSDTVLIVDTIGFLFSVYSISDMVVMGGTFDKKIGGHNLYEPAVQGKPIIGGPHHTNFPDIGTVLVQQEVYRVAIDSEEIISQLEATQKSGAGSSAPAARAAVEEKRGSTECTMKQLQHLLSP